MTQTTQLHDPPLNTSRVCGPMPQVAAYQICCAKCGAITTCAIDDDAVRMVCPCCGSQLTLPGTIEATCSACGILCEYPHTLAGHCTACRSCGASIVLPPLPARVRQRHSSGSHHHHHHRIQYSDRTMAFSDGAERAMILVAGAIATLIFVLIISMK